ncbi:MAG: AMP-binding protein, partial [Desulfomonilaceae bacterium]
MESIYEKKPWLSSYPNWVSHDLDIVSATARDDFIKTACSRPDAPAIYYFDHAISYGEVNRLSDSLAVAFQDFGLENGDRIILHLQNIPQFLISVYAAWKVGLIVVPLNPMYKEHELSYFFQDSGAKLFLTHDEIANALDLSFLSHTKVKRVITTSALDLLPPDFSPVEQLKSVKRSE